MKGLVIAEPWISKILSGEKTWEMRSRPTTTRGPIALIRKGSGLVVGVADLVDCRGPLDEDMLRGSIGYHQAPIELLHNAWNVAWVLRHVRPLLKPVPYSHPNGAVAWVRLAPEVVTRAWKLLAEEPSREEERCPTGNESHGEVPKLKANPGRSIRASGDTARRAEDLLASRFARTADPSVYIAGFRTPDGRELALERARRNAIYLWAESAPRDIGGIEVKTYAPEHTRNSNVNGRHAPRLALGRRASYLEIADMSALARFLDWYATNLP